MRYPWRGPVLTDEKLMNTNWAKRGFWWGAAGSAFSLGFAVWGVSHGGWEWWTYGALMAFLAWANGRRVPENYRLMRTWPERHATFQSDQARLFAMMARHGVPEDVARRIDQLAMVGRLDEAMALVAEHVQRPHP